MKFPFKPIAGGVIGGTDLIQLTASEIKDILTLPSIKVKRSTQRIMLIGSCMAQPVGAGTTNFDLTIWRGRSHIGGDFVTDEYNAVAAEVSALGFVMGIDRPGIPGEYRYTLAGQMADATGNSTLFNWSFVAFLLPD